METKEYPFFFPRVSANFVKVLAWYFSIIVAFALAFFVILKRPEASADGKDAEQDNEHFADPGLVTNAILLCLLFHFKRCTTIQSIMSECLAQSAKDLILPRKQAHQDDSNDTKCEFLISFPSLLLMTT